MPKITLSDISLKGCNLNKRVSNLRKIYFRAMPEICIERPRLITRFSLENGLFDQERISILDKARLTDMCWRTAPRLSTIATLMRRG